MVYVLVHNELVVFDSFFKDEKIIDHERIRKTEGVFDDIKKAKDEKKKLELNLIKHGYEPEGDDGYLCRSTKIQIGNGKVKESSSSVKFDIESFNLNEV